MLQLFRKTTESRERKVAAPFQKRKGSTYTWFLSSYKASYMRGNCFCFHGTSLRMHLQIYVYENWSVKHLFCLQSHSRCGEYHKTTFFFFQSDNPKAPMWKVNMNMHSHKVARNEPRGERGLRGRSAGSAKNPKEGKRRHQARKESDCRCGE